MKSMQSMFVFVSSVISLDIHGIAIVSYILISVYYVVYGSCFMEYIHTLMGKKRCIVRGGCIYTYL